MSSKAAEEYAQRARDGAVSRRYGSLADQRDRHAGRRPERRREGPQRAKSLAQQSKEWRQQGAKRRRKPRAANPGGYRSDDPRYQATSPKYAEGAEHGRRDCGLVAQCPSVPPLGPDSGSEWSAMYRAGYRDEWANNSPHICTKECPNYRGSGTE
jgi:hypothetical protein